MTDDVTVSVPYELVMRISQAMFDAVDEWHDELGMDDIDSVECLAAFIAAMRMSHDIILAESDGAMTLQ